MFLSILLQTVEPNQFNNFLALGYVAAFVIIMLYILFMINAQRNVRQDIELLERILQEDEPEPEV